MTNNLIDKEYERNIREAEKRGEEKMGEKVLEEIKKEKGRRINIRQEERKRLIEEIKERIEKLDHYNTMDEGEDSMVIATEVLKILQNLAKK